MKSWIYKNRLFYRTVSLTVIVSFILTGLPVPSISFQPFSYAAKSIPKQFFSIPQVSELACLSIPESLGSLGDSYCGDGGKAVVILQDNHCNYLAQQNIAKILSALYSGQLDKLLRCIAVEGASGDVDPGILTSLQEGDIKNEVLDVLLENGLISGSEEFIAHAGKNVGFYGVENKRLYEENVRYFTESMEYKEKVLGVLHDLDGVLHDIVKEIFSDELLAFYSTLEEIDKDTLDFYESIEKLASEYDIELAGFTNFQGMLASRSSEKDLDIDRMFAERQEMITELQKELVKEEAQLLVLQTLKYRTGRITSDGFYSYLNTMMSDHSIEASRYPNLSRYIRIVEIQSGIRPRELSEEKREIVASLKEKMFENGRQRELDEAMKRVHILTDLFKLELSRADYDYLKKNRDDFEADTFKEFISTHSAGRIAQSEKTTKDLAYTGGDVGAQYFEPVKRHPVADLSLLDKYIGPAEAFYKALIERDYVLVRNTLSHMDEKNLPLAVLVTGGFHTDGMIEELKQRRVSYFVVLTDSDLAQSNALYHEVVMREKGAFELLLSQAGKRLAPLLRLRNKLADAAEVKELEKVVAVVYVAMMLRSEKEKDIETILGEFPGDIGMDFMLNIDEYFQTDANGEIRVHLDKISDTEIHDYSGPMNVSELVEYFTGVLEAKKTQEISEEMLPVSERQFSLPPQSAFIGKYVPVDEDSITFSETGKTDETGEQIYKAVFQVINLESGETETVTLYAVRAQEGVFEGYEKDGVVFADMLDMYLDSVESQRFIIKPNKYGIGGIGTRDMLAVEENLADNPVALVHELTHGAVDAGLMDADNVIDAIEVNNEVAEAIGLKRITDIDFSARKAFEVYLDRKALTHFGLEGLLDPELDEQKQKELDAKESEYTEQINEFKERYRLHYALRLLQKSRWPDKDRQLTAKIRSIGRVYFEHELRNLERMLKGDFEHDDFVEGFNSQLDQNTEYGLFRLKDLARKFSKDLDTALENHLRYGGEEKEFDRLQEGNRRLTLMREMIDAAERYEIDKKEEAELEKRISELLMLISEKDFAAGKFTAQMNSILINYPGSGILRLENLQRELSTELQEELETHMLHGKEEKNFEMLLERHKRLKLMREILDSEIARDERLYLDEEIENLKVLLRKEVPDEYELLEIDDITRFVLEMNYEYAAPLLKTLKNDLSEDLDKELKKYLSELGKGSSEGKEEQFDRMLERDRRHRAFAGALNSFERVMIDEQKRVFIDEQIKELQEMLGEGFSTDDSKVPDIIDFILSYSPEYGLSRLQYLSGRLFSELETEIEDYFSTEEGPEEKEASQKLRRYVLLTKVREKITTAEKTLLEKTGRDARDEEIELAEEDLMPGPPLSEAESREDVKEIDDTDILEAIEIASVSDKDGREDIDTVPLPSSDGENKHRKASRGTGSSFSERKPVGVARKYVGIDTDSDLPRESLEKLLEIAAKEETELLLPHKDFLDTTYKLVEYDPNDEAGAFLSGVGGAYSIIDGDRIVVFISNDLSLKDQEHALDHELKEIIWHIRLSELSDELPEGFTVARAAHILAWAEQISEHNWTQVSDSPYMLAQLESMKDNDVFGLLQIYSEFISGARKQHTVLIKQFLGKDAAYQVYQFNRRVAETAGEMAEELLDKQLSVIVSEALKKAVVPPSPEIVSVYVEIMRTRLMENPDLLTSAYIDKESLSSLYGNLYNAVLLANVDARRTVEDLYEIPEEFIHLVLRGFFRNYSSRSFSGNIRSDLAFVAQTEAIVNAGELEKKEQELGKKERSGRPISDEDVRDLARLRAEKEITGLFQKDLFVLYEIVPLLGVSIVKNAKNAPTVEGTLVSGVTRLFFPEKDDLTAADYETAAGIISAIKNQEFRDIYTAVLRNVLQKPDGVLSDIQQEIIESSGIEALIEYLKFAFSLSNYFLERGISVNDEFITILFEYKDLTTDDGRQRVFNVAPVLISQVLLKNGLSAQFNKSTAYNLHVRLARDVANRMGFQEISGSNGILHFMCTTPLVESGMGVVYEGFTLLSNGEIKPVILKQVRDISADFSTEDRDRAMSFFELEVRNHEDLTRKVRSAGMKSRIAQHIDTVKSKDPQGQEFSQFLVMERAKGEDLDKVLKKELSMQQRLSICEGIDLAVRQMHEAGFAHLDLKPANIMVDIDNNTGEIKSVELIDFGSSAEINEQGICENYPGAEEAPATPGYAAPEQMSGLPSHRQNIGTQSDMFSLGTIVYEVLTGDELFSSDVNVYLQQIQQFIPDIRDSLLPLSSSTQQDLELVFNKIAQKKQDSSLPIYLLEHIVESLRLDPTKRIPAGTFAAKISEDLLQKSHQLTAQVSPEDSQKIMILSNLRYAASGELTGIEERLADLLSRSKKGLTEEEWTLLREMFSQNRDLIGPDEIVTFASLSGQLGVFHNNRIFLDSYMQDPRLTNDPEAGFALLLFELSHEILHRRLLLETMKGSIFPLVNGNIWSVNPLVEIIVLVLQAEMFLSFSESLQNKIITSLSKLGDFLKDDIGEQSELLRKRLQILENYKKLLNDIKSIGYGEHQIAGNTALREALISRIFTEISRRDSGKEIQEMETSDIQSIVTNFLELLPAIADIVKPKGQRGFMKQPGTKHPELSTEQISSLEAGAILEGKKIKLDDGTEAYLYYAPSEILEGLPSVNFRSKGDVFIVIDEAYKNTPIGNEALFHEKREAIWITKILTGDFSAYTRIQQMFEEKNGEGTFSPEQAAHIIASAETIQKFGKLPGWISKGRLSPFQEIVLKSTGASDVEYLITILLETQEERELHHTLLAYALSSGAQFTREHVLAYEDLFRDRAARRFMEVLSGEAKNDALSIVSSLVPHAALRRYEALAPLFDLFAEIEEIHRIYILEEDGEFLSRADEYLEGVERENRPVNKEFLVPLLERKKNITRQRTTVTLDEILLDTFSAEDLLLLYHLFEERLPDLAGVLPADVLRDRSYHERLVFDFRYMCSEHDDFMNLKDRVLQVIRKKYNEGFNLDIEEEYSTLNGIVQAALMSEFGPFRGYAPFSNQDIDAYAALLAGKYTFGELEGLVQYHRNRDKYKHTSYPRGLSHQLVTKSDDDLREIPEKFRYRFCELALLWKQLGVVPATDVEKRIKMVLNIPEVPLVDDEDTLSDSDDAVGGILQGKGIAALGTVILGLAVFLLPGLAFAAAPVVAAPVVSPWLIVAGGVFVAGFLERSIDFAEKDEEIVVVRQLVAVVSTINTSLADRLTVKIQEKESMLAAVEAKAEISPVERYFGYIKRLLSMHTKKETPLSYAYHGTSLYTLLEGVRKTKEKTGTFALLSQQKARNSGVAILSGEGTRGAASQDQGQENVSTTLSYKVARAYAEAFSTGGLTGKTAEKLEELRKKVETDIKEYTESRIKSMPAHYSQEQKESRLRADRPYRKLLRQRDEISAAIEYIKTTPLEEVTRHQKLLTVPMVFGIKKDVFAQNRQGKTGGQIIGQGEVFFEMNVKDYINFSDIDYIYVPEEYIDEAAILIEENKAELGHIKVLPMEMLDTLFLSDDERVRQTAREMIAAKEVETQRTKDELISDLQDKECAMIKSYDRNIFPGLMQIRNVMRSAESYARTFSRQSAKKVSFSDSIFSFFKNMKAEIRQGKDLFLQQMISNFTIISSFFSLYFTALIQSARRRIFTRGLQEQITFENLNSMTDEELINWARERFLAPLQALPIDAQATGIELERKNNDISFSFFLVDREGNSITRKDSSGEIPLGIQILNQNGTIIARLHTIFLKEEYKNRGFLSDFTRVKEAVYRGLGVQREEVTGLAEEYAIGAVVFGRLGYRFNERKMLMDDMLRVLLTSWHEGLRDYDRDMGVHHVWDILNELQQEGKGEELITDLAMDARRKDIEDNLGVAGISLKRKTVSQMLAVLDFARPLDDTVREDLDALYEEFGSWPNAPSLYPPSVLFQLGIQTDVGVSYVKEFMPGKTLSTITKTTEDQEEQVVSQTITESVEKEQLVAEPVLGGRAFDHALDNEQSNSIIQKAEKTRDIDGLETIENQIGVEEMHAFRRACSIASIDLDDAAIRLVVVDTDDDRFKAHYGNIGKRDGERITVFINVNELAKEGSGFMIAHELIEGNRLRSFIDSTRRDGESFEAAYERLKQEEPSVLIGYELRSHTAAELVIASSREREEAPDTAGPMLGLLLEAFSENDPAEFRRYLRETLRGTGRDAPVEELFGILEDSEGANKVLESLNLDEVEKRRLLDIFLINRVRTPKTGDGIAGSFQRVLDVLDRFEKERGGDLEILPVVSSIRQRLSAIIAQDSILEALVSESRKSMETASEQAGAGIQTMQRKAPVGVAIDIATLDAEDPVTWQGLARKLLESPRAFVVLVNHENTPESEAKLERLYGLLSDPEQFGELGKRLAKANIYETDPERVKRILDAEFKRLNTTDKTISDDNKVLFIAPEHAVFYEAFTGSIRALLADPKKTFLTESDRLFLEQAGVENADKIIKLFNEVVVTTDRTMKLMEVTEETRKKG